VLLAARRLRAEHPENNWVEVHGLLWIVDQLHEHGARGSAEIAAALRILERDASVRSLPVT
jgi:hypothetical protein